MCSSIRRNSATERIQKRPKMTIPTQSDYIKCNKKRKNRRYEKIGERLSNREKIRKTGKDTKNDR